MMNDPFALDAASEAAMEEFYSDPVEPPTKPVDQFSADLERDHRKHPFVLHPSLRGSQAAWDAAEVIIRWPSGEPLPVPRDMFAKYVDDATGEVLST
jgi:hypothetical protein